MTTVHAGDSPPDYTILDWLTQGAADGWSLTGYMHLMMYARRRRDLTQEDLEQAIAELVAAGAVEQEENPNDLRLPADRALELMLTRNYADQWRGRGGRRRLVRMSCEARGLLTRHTARAVEIDLLAALYTTVMVTWPDLSTRDAHAVTLRLAELCASCGGPHEDATVLRTLLSFDAAAGSPELLVDVIAGILAPAT